MSTVLINLKVTCGNEVRRLTFYFTPPAASTPPASHGSDDKQSAPAPAPLLVSLSTMIVRTFQSKLQGVSTLFLCWHDESGLPQPMLTDADVLAAVQSVVNPPSAAAAASAPPADGDAASADAPANHAHGTSGDGQHLNVTTALYNIIDTHSNTPNSSRGSATSSGSAYHSHHHTLRIDDHSQEPKVLRLSVLNDVDTTPTSVHAIAAGGSTSPSTPADEDASASAPPPSASAILLVKLFGNQQPPSLLPPPSPPQPAAEAAAVSEPAPAASGNEDVKSTPQPHADAPHTAVASTNAAAAVNFFANAAAAKMMGGVKAAASASAVPVSAGTTSAELAPAATAPAAAATAAATSTTAATTSAASAGSTTASTPAPVAVSATTPAPAQSSGIKAAVWNRVSALAGYIPFSGRLGFGGAKPATAPTGNAGSTKPRSSSGDSIPHVLTAANPNPNPHHPNLSVQIPHPLSISTGSLDQPPSVHSVASRESDAEGIAAALAAADTNLLHESFDEHKLKEDLRPCREELELELEKFLHSVILRFGFESDNTSAGPTPAGAPTAADGDVVVFDAAAATATATATATAASAGPDMKWSELYKFEATKRAFQSDITRLFAKYAASGAGVRRAGSIDSIPSSGASPHMSTTGVSGVPPP